MKTMKAVTMAADFTDFHSLKGGKKEQSPAEIVKRLHNMVKKIML